MAMPVMMPTAVILLQIAGTMALLLGRVPTSRPTSSLRRWQGEVEPMVVVMARQCRRTTIFMLVLVFRLLLMLV